MRTDSDMLTEVVKRGEGGIIDSFDIMHLISIEIVSGRVIVKHMDKYNDVHEEDLSLPDLIADHEFMKAVYGDGLRETGFYSRQELKKQEERFLRVKTRFLGQVLPAWQYHALEALKLSHAGENSVQYLFENLPENV